MNNTATIQTIKGTKICALNDALKNTAKIQLQYTLQRKKLYYLYLYPTANTQHLTECYLSVCTTYLKSYNIKYFEILRYDLYELAITLIAQLYSEQYF